MKCEKTFTHNYYGSKEDSYYKIEEFYIFTCLSCHSVTVLLFTATGIDEEDAAWAENHPNEPMNRSYKRTVIYAPAKPMHWSIPQDITEVTKQAEAVLFNSPRASFILCRAVLEEICNDFQIPAKAVNKKGEEYYLGLNIRLTDLFDKEQMPAELKDLINEVRILGNQGAHSDHFTFSKQVKSQEAESLLMLTNYIVERLYVDKHRQEEAAKTLKILKEKIQPSNSQN